MARRFIFPLIEEEHKQGHESCLVVSRFNGEGKVKKIPYDLSLNGFPFIVFRLIRIIFFILSYKPDIVFSHNTKSSLLPLFAACFARVKERVYFNHGVPYIGYSGILRIILILLEYLNCRLATRIITVSEDMAELIRSAVKNAQPELIHNGSACGIDLNEFNYQKYSDGAWRREHGFDNEDMVVVYIGRPERRKGFVHALQLWQKFPLNSRCKLVLCGPDTTNVLSVLPEVPPNIIGLGFVNNIPEILCNADALILPSYHEGLPYATLEAMASGCIVMVNDIPGVRCVVHHGVNGFLIKDNSIDVFFEIINDIQGKKIDIDSVRLQSKMTAKLFKREDFLYKYTEFISKISI